MVAEQDYRRCNDAVHGLRIMAGIASAERRRRVQLEDLSTDRSQRIPRVAFGSWAGKGAKKVPLGPNHVLNVSRIAAKLPFNMKTNDTMIFIYDYLCLFIDIDILINIKLSTPKLTTASRHPA